MVNQRRDDSLCAGNYSSAKLLILQTLIGFSGLNFTNRRIDLTTNQDWTIRSSLARLPAAGPKRRCFAIVRLGRAGTLSAWNVLQAKPGESVRDTRCEL